MALLLPSTPPGALTDREKLWLAMRELRTFSLRDLYLETKIDRRTGKARDYLVGLLRAGILEEISHVDAARQNSPGECVITSGTSDCMRCKKIAKAGQVPAFFVSPVVVWGMAGLACAGA